MTQARENVETKNNAESVGKFQPRVCFETRVQKWLRDFFATLINTNLCWLNALTNDRSAKQ